MGMLRFTLYRAWFHLAPHAPWAELGSHTQQSFSLDVETITHTISIPSSPLKSPFSFDLLAGTQFWAAFRSLWRLCACPHLWDLVRYLLSGGFLSSLVGWRCFLNRAYHSWSWFSFAEVLTSLSEALFSFPFALPLECMVFPSCTCLEPIWSHLS